MKQQNFSISNFGISWKWRFLIAVYLYLKEKEINSIHLEKKRRSIYPDDRFESHRLLISKKMWPFFRRFLSKERRSEIQTLISLSSGSWNNFRKVAKDEILSCSWVDISSASIRHYLEEEAPAKILWYVDDMLDHSIEYLPFVEWYDSYRSGGTHDNI